MENVKIKHLDHLQGRMDFVSTESNNFSNKYMIGGIIVIISLLNIDILIEKNLNSMASKYEIVYFIVIMLIGLYYFYVIGQRIIRFERAYRKTKFKYEVVLYNVLQDVDLKKELESGFDDLEKKEMVITFNQLKNQHKKKYDDNKLWIKIAPAVIITSLTFIAKMIQIYLW